MPALSPITAAIKVSDKFSAGLQKFNKRVNDVTAPVRKLQVRVHRLSQEAGLQRLGKSLKLVKNRLGGVASEAGVAFRRITMLGGAAAAGIYAMVNSTAVAGDRIAKISSQLGLSTDAYQELMFAADRSGVSQGVFNSSIGAFTKRLGEARVGMGGLASYLKKFSPSLLKQMQSTKTAEEGLMLLFNAMDKIEDPTIRASLASAAFSRAGIGMVNLTKGGSKEIEKLREQYRRLGGTISEDAAKASEDFIDAQTDMKLAIAGVRNIIGGQLMPQITELTKKLTEFVVKNRGKITAFAKKFAEGLPERIDKIIKASKDLYLAIEPFVKIIGAIVNVIGPANTAMGVMAVFIGGKLVMAIAALIPALASLGITIGATPIGWFIGIVAALVGLVYLIIKHWSKISGFFSGLWGSIKSATSTFIGWYVDSWTGVWDFFVGLWDGIVAKVQGALGFVNKAIDKLPNWLKKGIQVGLNMATGNVSGAVSGAREILGGGSQQTIRDKNETRVKVDFVNMPKGTRVQQSGDAPTDLSMGYAMVTP